MRFKSVIDREKIKTDENEEIFGDCRISDFEYKKSFNVKGSYILQMNDSNINSVMEYLNFAYFSKDDELDDLSHIDYVNELSEELDFGNDNLKKNEEKIHKVFNHLNKYKVLTPIRNGGFGCDTLNKKFSLFYEKKIGKNNVSPKILEDGKKIMNGIPIMVTRNDYKNGIFNGDIGIVLKDKNSEFRVIFKVKNEFRAYAVSDFEFFEVAFSTTIHKSQGSEYKNVFIPIESGDLDENGKPKDGLLTNELIYTAVTRAKECFIIFSGKDYLKAICKNPICRINHIDLIRN